ncbi:MAG TPA: poly-beta-1,6-N-acetyl-D-glucosamine biosynthesis protein PgaD [Tahibacter sp.]|nr:poly-beta-1,6-N-acetyl-D-glucosamine biosynthesis protein PgaD [Tahibacter sp.]
MNAELIISLPQQQNPLQRRLYTALTALAWVAWIHLWLPLVTLIAWGVGLGQVYRFIVVDDAAHGLDDLVFLVRAGTACAAVFLLWTSYNRWRFRGVERRGPVADATPQAIADYFGANDVVSDRLRRVRRTVLHIDAEGRPVRAVVAPPSRLPPTPVVESDDEHGYDLRPVVSEHPEALTPVGHSSMNC